MRGDVQRGVLLLDRDRAVLGVLAASRRRRSPDRRAPSSSPMSSCSYPGVMSRSSGSTHIWTKCTASACSGSPRQRPRVVLLGVQDAGACGHALRQPGIDDAGVPAGVLMHERPFEHPCDDLHVAVRVGLEPGAGEDVVVVADQQQPEVGVPRVVVLPERERVLRVEPAPVGGETVRAALDVHLRHLSILRVHTRGAFRAPWSTLGRLSGARWRTLGGVVGHRDKAHAVRGAQLRTPWRLSLRA